MRSEPETPRGEVYEDLWPLLTDPASDASVHAETADSLSMAFLVLLESLSPGRPGRSLDIAEGLVQTIRAVSNPEKLRHLGPRPRRRWPIVR